MKKTKFLPMRWVLALPVNRPRTKPPKPMVALMTINDLRKFRTRIDKLIAKAVAAEHAKRERALTVAQMQTLLETERATNDRRGRGALLATTSATRRTLEALEKRGYVMVIGGESDEKSVESPIYSLYAITESGRARTREHRVDMQQYEFELDTDYEPVPAPDRPPWTPPTAARRAS